MEVPCCKKQRLDPPTPTFQIKPVLSDELCEAIPLEPVVVTTVTDRKTISSIIIELSQRLPLPSLQHLKRVRQNEIILCRVTDVELIAYRTSLLSEDVSKIKEYLLSHGIPIDMASKFCEKLHLGDVPSISPKLRWQYDVVNKLWPCKFHANKYAESLFDGTIFSHIEREYHCKMASLLTHLSDREDSLFGLCIDPRTNSIVAVARGVSDRSPVMHCPMVLIDLVARSQNGGAWQYNDKFHCSNDKQLNCKGIPERLHKIIYEFAKEDVRFGAESLSLNESRRKVTEDIINENNLVKYGPYLCTGYDVYLIAEPCLMCAMALLHSRVRRIFYLNSSENGALQTRVKLHAVKDLNHHFEVFYCKSERKSSFNKCS